eukprot:Gb_08318 [translate_table: standard]
MMMYTLGGLHAATNQTSGTIKAHPQSHHPHPCSWKCAKVFHHTGRPQPPPETGDSVLRPSLTGEEPQHPSGTGNHQLSRQRFEAFPSYGSLSLLQRPMTLIMPNGLRGEAMAMAVATLRLALASRSLQLVNARRLTLHCLSTTSRGYFYNSGGCQTNILNIEVSPQLELGLLKEWQRSFAKAKKSILKRASTCEISMSRNY